MIKNLAIALVLCASPLAAQQTSTSQSNAQAQSYNGGIYQEASRSRDNTPGTAIGGSYFTAPCWGNGGIGAGVPGAGGAVNIPFKDMACWDQYVLDRMAAVDQMPPATRDMQYHYWCSTDSRAYPTLYMFGRCKGKRRDHDKIFSKLARQ